MLERALRVGSAAAGVRFHVLLGALVQRARNQNAIAGSLLARIQKMADEQAGWPESHWPLMDKMLMGQPGLGLGAIKGPEEKRASLSTLKKICEQSRANQEPDSADSSGRKSQEPEEGPSKARLAQSAKMDDSSLG